MLERTQVWLHRPIQGPSLGFSVQVAENEGPQFETPGHAVSRIRITPVRDPFQPTPATAPAETPKPIHLETRPPIQPGPSPGSG